MHSQQITWNLQAGWSPVDADPEKVALVFYFGTREVLACGTRYHELREIFPAAHILGCSTGGQINNSDVNDDGIVAAAIRFDSTRLRLISWDVTDASQSWDCGEAIGKALCEDDLCGVFLLSDGLNVNGSGLVNGLVSAIGHGVPLTGGLAGDGANFTETLVGGNCAPRSRMAVGIGRNRDLPPDRPRHDGGAQTGDRIRHRLALVLGQFEEGLGVSRAHVRRLGIVRH